MHLTLAHVFVFLYACMYGPTNLKQRQNQKNKKKKGFLSQGVGVMPQSYC